ncbi:hypothetical protein GQ55_3G464100 [Panicum hallii var. hallii]|uniref:BURP domain-containing protein n=1 Tax=Panicum hallii var. hallii TaxID=1504633 RepID=A0A2T7EJ08_9POAL|nr:hypothetical protein GQ55_3G464100 [Panicum hallii var. hallii]
MHPTVLFVAVVAITAAVVHGRRPADGSPAARFWEEVLPGTPMPEALAELVQKGIDHLTLAENFSGPYLSIGMCLGHVYVSVCSVERVKKAGTGLFFHEEQVRVGSTLTVSFSAAGVPAILPHDVAEKVPFGNITARDVATRFNIAPGSTMAAQVGDTLRACQARAGGERHACAASLEDMVRAAMRTLGTAGRVWVAASAVPRAGLPLQPYAVEAVAPLDGDHHVACHDEPYPYAVFQCHRIGLSMTKAYAVSLRGLRGGPEVTMAVICHLDTSDWNPAYPAFEMLHTKPGDSSVCHFMPYANLLFGVKAASTMASF